MQQIEITVARRIRTGKNVSRRLRGKERIPGIVYGLEKQAVPVEVEAKSMRTLGAMGDNAIFLLKMQGTDVTRHAILKELQRDPLSGQLLHIDFLRIDLTRRITVKVPVHVTGTAAGIKEGGILEFVHREVEVECLPLDIPAGLDVDVSHLKLGDAVRASDLKLPESVKLLEGLETVLAVVHAPKAEEVAAPVEGVPAAGEPVVMAKGKEAKEGAPAEKEASPGAKAAPAAKAEKGEKKEKK